MGHHNGLGTFVRNAVGTRQIIGVPKLVPELVGGIKRPLECKELIDIGISCAELAFRSVNLIRKIVGATKGCRGIDQLSGPDTYRFFVRFGRSLFIVKDESEYLGSGPGQ